MEEILSRLGLFTASFRGLFHKSVIQPLFFLPKIGIIIDVGMKLVSTKCSLQILQDGLLGSHNPRKTINAKTFVSKLRTAFAGLSLAPALA